MYKKYLFHFIILALALTDMSCDNRRNPNLKAKQLQSLVAENVLSGQTLNTGNKSSGQQRTMLEGNVPPAGVKYLPERDMRVPPTRIDVLKGIDNVRNVTLSQLVRDIAYINIGAHRFGVNIQITPHGILVNSLDGAWLYNAEGKLIREIYSNLCEYQPIGLFGSAVQPGNKFRGIEQLIYNEKDDRIWLSYRKDNLSGFLGYIDLSGQLTFSNDEIKKDPVVPLANFARGHINYTENFVIHRPFLQANYLITNTCFGDTLCCFTVGYDTVRYGIFRKAMNVDSGIDYYYDGVYSIRPPFNDTLFRVTAAYILKPEYIFDLGNGALLQEKATDMHYNQLYVLRDIREDDRFLYVSFTIKNYNGRNEAKQWWGLYDKNIREFFTLPATTAQGRFYERGIENDLDGGLPFWPKGIDSRGEKFMNVPGKEMKSILTETWLSESKASQPKKKDELENFVRTLKDDDLVIIIVK